MREYCTPESGSIFRPDDLISSESITSQAPPPRLVRSQSYHDDTVVPLLLYWRIYSVSHRCAVLLQSMNLFDTDSEAILASSSIQTTDLFFRREK